MLLSAARLNSDLLLTRWSAEGGQATATNWLGQVTFALGAGADGLAKDGR